MAKAPLVPKYTFRELRKVAEDFLADHHPTGELPIPIEEIVEFELHLDIVPVPGLLDLDIDAFITSDLKEIRVDQYIMDKVPTRYRASLAHEVSHPLIHTAFFEELKFATVAEWKTTLASLKQSEVDKLEYQARLLGALLLVPPAPLALRFQETLTKLPGSLSLHRLSEKGRDIVIAGIAKDFGVSPQLMKNRLGQDRLI